MHYRALLLRRSPSFYNPPVLGAQRFNIRPISTQTSGQSGDNGVKKNGSVLEFILKSISTTFVIGTSLAFCCWDSLSHTNSAIAYAESDSQGGENEKKPTFIVRDAYRRKVFFKYEKRIRTQSPPEKVFEYFASYHSPSGEIFMTPADLMRAIVPVFPPSNAIHVRGGYLKGELAPSKLRCDNSRYFMLFDTNNDGFISFPEYIFFVTLLSIPESSFSVAFKMFDIDNSGYIEMEEFKKVMALMRTQNRQGARHSDGMRVGLKVSGSVENGGLLEYFFGKDGKECLELGKFVQFLRDLHDEILRLEFAHYDYESKGTISAKDFALSMVASADMRHINKFLQRVEELDDENSLKDVLFTFEEFKNLAELRKRLQPLSMAIFSYGKVNGLLTKQDFQRAAYQVCEISLSDNVVDMIFYMFDMNRDGSLSSDEFLRVLQRRAGEVPQTNDSGFMGVVSCLLACKKNCSSNILL